MGGVKWTQKSADDAVSALARRWPAMRWASLPFNGCLGVCAAGHDPHSERRYRHYSGPAEFNALAKWVRQAFDV